MHRQATANYSAPPRNAHQTHACRYIASCTRAVDNNYRVKAGEDLSKCTNKKGEVRERTTKVKVCSDDELKTRVQEAADWLATMKEAQLARIVHPDITSETVRPWFAHAYGLCACTRFAFLLSQAHVAPACAQLV